MRHEAIEGDPKLGDLLTLEERHTTNVTALEAKGVNVNVFKAKLPRRAIIARATGPAAQLQALVENGVAHSSVWHHCGAIALNSDVVLAAEGARLVAERDAAAATQQQQQSDLSLLRDQAIAIETQREIDTKEYDDLTAAQRATITKCLFQLKGMTGFSKIKGKPAEVDYLEGYEEDVIDALLLRRPHDAQFLLFGAFLLFFLSNLSNALADSAGRFCTKTNLLHRAFRVEFAR